MNATKVAFFLLWVACHVDTDGDV